MLWPSPAVIVSGSKPPKTMSEPAPVRMMSDPPTSDSIEMTRPSVIGWPPNCGAGLACGADLAAVAEDEVAALAGDDAVAQVAAEDDVVAAAGRDRVRVAEVRIAATRCGRCRPGRGRRRRSVPPRSAAAQSIRPLSPKTMLLPSPARIVSSPMPPSTMSAPASVRIVSKPPVSDSIVRTSPSVSGSAPNHAPSAVADVISPLSPKTMLRPPPPVIVSPSKPKSSVHWIPGRSSTSSPSSPAITTSSPLPVVIVSLPPVSGSIDQMRSMSAASPSSSDEVDEAVVAEDDRGRVGRAAPSRRGWS